MTDLEKWVDLLEQKDARITVPRKAILELMLNADRALTPLEIYAQVRAHHPKIGLVTVYRTVELLVELGLIERIHQAEGCHMYLRAAGGHQHVILCTHCGRAAHFRGDNLKDLFEKVSRESGFAVEDHWLQLQGVCKDCQ